MAGISFSGVKHPQTEVEKIQTEVFADWGTFRDMDVAISEGHKSGADVYESQVSVNLKAYTGAAVTASSDEFNVQKSPVNLVKQEVSGIVNYATLLDTRFEKSMQRGAFNTISNEFDRKILIQMSPAISVAYENLVWNGATAATKAAIAALTPGAGQGSITAATQAVVASAAVPVNLVDSIVTRILYNDSLSKATGGAGLGDYKKVTGTTVTSANIAAEYAKIYAAIDPADLATGRVKIHAPLNDKQLIMIANNSVGAAQQVNFLVQGDKVSYNGIEIKFKPIESTFRIACDPEYLKILMDLKSDLGTIETDKMADGADSYYYKNVVAIATWVTNQANIVLYGG